MSQASPSPLFFGPAERPLFGWIHRPPAAAPPSRRGLVVCNPFGYEAVCAHRSLREIAAAAAAAGVPSMRFDYDGTGDSAGDDHDPERVKAWVASIQHAIDALKSATGVAQVCLLGVRLGALLASVAAADRDDVSGLVAVAPVLSGKMYLRELRLLQMALGLREPPAGKASFSGDGDGDVQEAVGFALTAETRASLSAIDLVRQDRRPPKAVLILDRADLPVADRWAERLAASGAELEARRLPGFVEMMLDPHRAVVPEEIIGAATAWLQKHAASAPGTAASRGAAESTAGAAPIPANNTTASVNGVVERAIHLHPAHPLFGIVSLPAPGGAQATGVGIVLLNAGAVHRIGPNRLYTPLARRWAALGHTVLRVDLSGLGDSRARPGEPESSVYSARALEDVAVALEYLRREHGLRECRAIGLCSGAYHAFKAAVAGQPVDAVIAINPLTFFWNEGDSLDYAPHIVVETAERHAQAFTSVEKWRKLLRGKVDVRAAIEVLARHTASRLLNRARAVSRRFGLPLQGDLGAELEAVARRGVDLRFVLASDDPGLGLLRLQGGSVVSQLRERGALSIAMIDGPDHTFTRLWSHAELGEVLTSAIEQPARRRGR